MFASPDILEHILGGYKILFHFQGCSWSVIFVDLDAHNRNRQTLCSLLPRESRSHVSNFAEANRNGERIRFNKVLNCIAVLISLIKGPELVG